jgi:Protein of unknown function (DUF4230)
MKIAKRSIVAAMLIFVGTVLGWWIHEWRQAAFPPSLPEIESGPTLEQIQTLSSLTTLKVNVADALVTELEGKTGGIKAVLVVHGSVTLGVDLSKARFESVNQNNRTAVLLLPAPRMQFVTLDQEKTKVVALCESGLWIIVPAEGEACAAAANLAYRQAQRIVAQAARDQGLDQRSRLQAISVLTAFFVAMEWTVQVRWIAAPRFPTSGNRG